MSGINKWWIAVAAAVVAVLFAANRMGDGNTPSEEVRESGARIIAVAETESTVAKPKSKSTEKATDKKSAKRVGDPTGKPAPVLVLSGRVAEKGSGRGFVAGAEIWIEAQADQKLRKVRSDETGQFSLTIPAPQEPLTLMASSPSHAPAAISIPAVTLDPAAPAARTLMSVEIGLAAPAVLNGIVQDETGKPVPAAAITIARKSGAVMVTDSTAAPSQSVQTWAATTEADGKFRLANLPEGELTVRAAKEGYLEEARKFRLPVEMLTVDLRKQGQAVEGMVFSDSGGRPVSGAKVHLTSAVKAGSALRYETVTDADGLFQLSDLPAGEYHIDAEKDALLLKPLDGLQGNRFSIAAGDATKSLTLSLYQGQVLTGKVTDKGNKSPIEGAVVESLTPPMRQATTNKDGEFLLGGITAAPEGPWLPLRVSKAGYEIDEMPMIRMNPDETEVVKNFEMLPKVSVRGRVVNGAGDGVPGAAIFDEPYGQQTNHYCDSTGNFEVPVRPYSEFTIFAKAAGYGPGQSEQAYIDRESTSGVVIVLSPEASIEGLVVDEEGRPVAEAWVQAVKWIEEARGYVPPLVATPTDSNGRFTLKGLPSGDIGIRAVSQEHSRAPYQKINLNGGETRTGVRVVLLTELSLEGTVTDDMGNPIEKVGLMVGNVTGTQSDRNGKFIMSGLFTKKVDLNAYAWGAPGLYENVELKGVAVDQKDLRVIMRKSRSYTLIGSVIDFHTSEPIVQLTVEISDKEQPLAADSPSVVVTYEGPGLFTAGPLHSASRYNLLISAPGYVASRGGAIYPKSNDGSGEDVSVVKRTFGLVKLSAAPLK